MKRWFTTVILSGLEEYNKHTLIQDHAQGWNLTPSEKTIKLYTTSGEVVKLKINRFVDTYAREAYEAAVKQEKELYKDIERIQNFIMERGL